MEVWKAGLGSQGSISVKEQAAEREELDTVSTLCCPSSRSLSQ